MFLYYPAKNVFNRIQLTLAYMKFCIEIHKVDKIQNTNSDVLYFNEADRGH